MQYVCGHKFKELEYGQEYHGSGTELSNRMYNWQCTQHTY